MRKQIIAMLLAVTMCTELLAGCQMSMAADTMISAGESREAESQGAVWLTSSSVPKQTEAGAEEQGIDITRENAIQAGADGVIRGKLVSSSNGLALQDAQITVKDEDGKSVSVQPGKIYTTQYTQYETESGQIKYVLFKDTPPSMPIVPVFLDGFKKAGNSTTICKTDEKGEFVFQLPEPGEYTLCLYHPAYHGPKEVPLSYYDSTISTEAFEKGILIGTAQGLGKLAGKEEMEQIYTFLNQNWTRKLALAGSEDTEALLQQIESACNQVLVGKNASPEKILEGIKAFAKLTMAELRNPADFDEKGLLSGWLLPLARTVQDAFLYEETRTELLRTHSSWENYASYYSTPQAKKEITELTIDTSLNLITEAAPPLKVLASIPLFMTPVCQAHDKNF